MKVKDKLNQGNWYKGGWGTNPQGQVVDSFTTIGMGAQFCKLCLKAALFLYREGPYRHKANLVRDAIQDLYPDRTGRSVCEIVSFNDHPDTTWEDVERVLERADV